MRNNNLCLIYSTLVPAHKQILTWNTSVWMKQSKLLVLSKPAPRSLAPLRTSSGFYSTISRDPSPFPASSCPQPQGPNQHRSGSTPAQHKALDQTPDPTILTSSADLEQEPSSPWVLWCIMGNQCQFGCWGNCSVRRPLQINAALLASQCMMGFCLCTPHKQLISENVKNEQWIPQARYTKPLCNWFDTKCLIFEEWFTINSFVLKWQWTMSMFKFVQLAFGFIYIELYTAGLKMWMTKLIHFMFVSYSCNYFSAQLAAHTGNAGREGSSWHEVKCG